MKRKRARRAPASRKKGATLQSRRRFITLVAAGSAALLAAPAMAARSLAAPKGGARPEAKAPSAAARAEIKTQKDYLSNTLKTIRGFALPPGSDMAFAFRPLKARARKKRAAGGGKS